MLHSAGALITFRFCSGGLEVLLWAVRGGAWRVISGVMRATSGDWASSLITAGRAVMAMAFWTHSGVKDWTVPSFLRCWSRARRVVWVASALARSALTVFCLRLARVLPPIAPRLAWSRRTTSTLIG